MTSPSRAAQLPNPAVVTPVIYKVRPGDSASRILQEFYGVTAASPQYRAALQFLQIYNPQVRQIDHLYPGQMLRLMPLESGSGLSYCPAPAEWPDGEMPQLPHALRPSDFTLERYRSDWPDHPGEDVAFWALAMLQEHYNWLAIPGGTALGTLGNLTRHGNNALLREVQSLYEQYKRGAISKGQYDAGRRRLLKQYAQLVGPFERFLMGGRTTQEAIRISRMKGVPATHRIESQLHRLRKMSRLATAGGVVLTGGGLYFACRDISQTRNRHEKNEILVEAAASTMAGTVMGVTISIVLASNPVGWGLGLVLAAGTATVSWGTGQAARRFYNAQGEQIDLVAALDIDKLCN